MIPQSKGAMFRASAVICSQLQCSASLTSFPSVPRSLTPNKYVSILPWCWFVFSILLATFKLKQHWQNIIMWHSDDKSGCKMLLLVNLLFCFASHFSFQSLHIVRLKLAWGERHILKWMKTTAEIILQILLFPTIDNLLLVNEYETICFTSETFTHP